jgi:hypothetical protein
VSILLVPVISLIFDLIEVLSTSLPVAALPFTLRSSSLQKQPTDSQFTSQSTMDSTGGMPSSRWAPNESRVPNFVASTSQQSAESEWASAPTFRPREIIHDETVSSQVSGGNEVKRPVNDFMAHARNFMGREGSSPISSQASAQKFSKAVPIKQEAPVTSMNTQVSANQASVTQPKGHLGTENQQTSTVPASLTTHKENMKPITNGVSTTRNPSIDQLNLKTHFSGKVLIDQDEIVKTMGIISTMKNTATNQNNSIILLDDHLSAAKKIIGDAEQIVDSLAELLATFQEKVDLAKSKLDDSHSQITLASEVVIKVAVPKTLEDDLNSLVQSKLGFVHGEEVSTKIEAKIKEYIKHITESIKKEAAEEAVVALPAKKVPDPQTQPKPTDHKDTASQTNVKIAQENGHTNGTATTKPNTNKPALNAPMPVTNAQAVIQKEEKQVDCEWISLSLFSGTLTM